MNLKTYLLLFLSALVLYSCSENYKVPSNMDKTKDKMKELSQVIFSFDSTKNTKVMLPLGVNLYGTVDDFINNAESITKKQVNKGDSVCLKFVTKSRLFGNKEKTLNVKGIRMYQNGKYRDSLECVYYDFIDKCDSVTFMEYVSEVMEYTDCFFDDSWKKIILNLNDAYNYKNSEGIDMCCTFWVKGNVCAELDFSKKKRCISLNFYNMKRCEYKDVFYGINYMLYEINGYNKKIKEEADGDLIVKGSWWDGSVDVVEKFVKEYLEEPDSYQPLEWSDVEYDGYHYWVYHTYLAKDSVNGYYVSTRKFVMDGEDGRITNSELIK